MSWEEVAGEFGLEVEGNSYRARWPELVHRMVEEIERLREQRDALIRDLAKSQVEVAELSKMNSDGCDLLGVEIGRLRESEAKRAKLRHAMECMGQPNMLPWEQIRREALAADAVTMKETDT